MFVNGAQEETAHDEEQAHGCHAVALGSRGLCDDAHEEGAEKCGGFSREGVEAVKFGFFVLWDKAPHEGPTGRLVGSGK